MKDLSLPSRAVVSRAFVATSLVIAAAVVWAPTAQALPPGKPSALTIKQVSANPMTGASSMTASWLAPASSPPPTGYKYQKCQQPSGAVVCGSSSASWGPESTTTTTSVSFVCPAGNVTCYFRVRALYGSSPTSVYVTANYQPWAPFSVDAVPGTHLGDVAVFFGGPRESGPGPDNSSAGKTYKLLVCQGNASSCASGAAWTGTGTPANYPPTADPHPPTANSPYKWGEFACSSTCTVRLQFALSSGTVSMMSNADTAP
jgi:hypothetical protein